MSILATVLTTLAGLYALTLATSITATLARIAITLDRLAEMHSWTITAHERELQALDRMGDQP